jgi:hypothetical protein
MNLLLTILRFLLGLLPYDTAILLPIPVMSAGASPCRPQVPVVKTVWVRGWGWLFLPSSFRGRREWVVDPHIGSTAAALRQLRAALRRTFGKSKGWNDMATDFPAR